MKTSTKKILIILFVSILLLSLTRFVFDVFKIKEYIYFIILALSFISSIILLGYNKNRNSKEKNLIITYLIFTLLFQVLIFVFFGLKSGFLSSGYTLGVTHLFKIVLPVLLIIILSEIYRYQIIEKGRSSKVVLISITIFFVILDFLIGSSIYSLNTFKGWFELFASVLVPSIMKNILLTYTVYNYGYKPSIVYRLVMEISIYYLPIVPDISNYLNSVLNIIFPFLILIFVITYTSNIELNPKEKTEKKNNKYNKVINIFIFIILLIFVGLMSGLFKYYFLVVGSGSMEPKLEVGDMALVEKIKDHDKLKTGDVLVYKNSDKVILHRIVEIKKDGGELIFKTKGDNNDAVDSWEVTEKDVIGKVNFRLQKIGYPTIWLNELFKGGN